MFFLEALDVTGQFERLLVVTIPDACVHQLRHLQNLQQLSVTLQSHVIQPPTATHNGQQMLASVQAHSQMLAY